MGRWLIVLGLALVAVGLLLTYAPRILSWWGHLPGDVRIERGGWSIYIPLASSLVTSLLLTLILNLIFRWFRDR
jgi:hypothetical protein